jgi:hypothetical protein
VALREARGHRVWLLALIAVAAGVLGGLIGLRLAGPHVDETDLGSVRARVALSGFDRSGIEVYVPLADWGVRARVFKLPLRIELEPRAPDRDAVARAVAGDDALLRHTRGQVDELMRAAVARAALWALVGAVLGGLLALLAWERLGVRGRGLALAPLVSAATAVVIISAATLWGVLSYDSRRIEHPTYFAAGEELDRLLDQAGQLRTSGRRYSGQVESALGAILALANTERVPAGPQRRAVLASDLHANALALPVLRRYARGVPLFMPGDLSVNGARLEADLLRGIENAGEPVVMTSGNHDSSALMRSFARRGAIVLTHRGRADGAGNVAAPAVRRIAGLQVAGFEDPLAYQGRGYPVGVRATLSFTDLPDGDERFAEAADRYWEWWNALPRRPDVLLIHQAALARDLAARIEEADPAGAPLAILAGHTHHQRVDLIGPVTVVDAGSVGAGGPFGAGKDDIGLGILSFGRSPTRLVTADVASIDPRNGAASAQRIVTDNPDCEAEIVHCVGR